MKPQDLLELILLAAVWGASFLFMRTATPEFGAVALVAVRTAVAAVFLLPILLFTRKHIDVVKYWKPILFVGLVNTAIPFCLFSYATVELGAGFGSILNATAPMFGALVGYLWLRDQLSPVAVVGLITGFAGVVVISSARSGLQLDVAVVPVLAALAATFSYGVAACYAKRYLVGVGTLAIATGSQAYAALALAPFAVLYWPEQMPSMSAWWQVIVLGVACTAFAYILYFRLIANVGAAKAITVAYLVPVFGVLWGVIFLAEIVTVTLMVGAALILLGVGLTTGLWRFWHKAYS